MQSNPKLSYPNQGLDYMPNVLIWFDPNQIKMLFQGFFSSQNKNGLEKSQTRFDQINLACQVNSHPV